MDESRIERHCPDPACDWKLIETPRAIGPHDLPKVPFQGSLHETLHESIHQTARDQARIVDAACETHIREVHDPVDPIGWAQRTAAQERAKALLLAAAIGP